MVKQKLARIEQRPKRILQFRDRIVRLAYESHQFGSLGFGRQSAEAADGEFVEYLGGRFSSF